MNSKILLVVAAIPFLIAAKARPPKRVDPPAPKPPHVSERMDAVVVFRVKGQGYRRIFFIKGGLVRAKRLHYPEMYWDVTEDGDFALRFVDYQHQGWGAIDREVLFKEYVVVNTTVDPLKVDKDSPWWGMRRIIGNLKLP